jgi:hypothetical protein
MKLLKLESETVLSESVFTNNISVGSGLEFPAQCQIALKNLSIDFSVPTRIIITSDNNTFRFKTKDTFAYYEVVLTPKTYTLTNLVKEIQSKMNNKLQSYIVNADYALMWKVDFDPNEPRIVIAFDRAKPITLVSANSTLEKMSYQSTGSYFYKSTADTGSFDSYLSGNIMMSNGGFEMKATLIAQGSDNINTSDWILGIDNDNLSMALNSKALIKDALFACISVNTSNGTYTFKKAGILQASLIAVAANDVLSIHKKDDKIEYSITKGSTTTNVEGDIINDVMPELGSRILYYSVHVANDTGKIGFNSLNYTPNPWATSSDGVYVDLPAYQTPNIYLNTNLIGITNSSKVSIFFNNENLRQLLGYMDEIQSITNSSGTFPSQEFIGSTPFVDDMEVEVIELGSIGSYSQISKQLKGIVGVISKAELLKSTINTGFETYQLSWAELASFAWLSVDNNQPLRMPSLSVRCTSANKLITMNGKLAITLLYKPASEK